MLGSQVDFSRDASFIQAVKNKIYYGSVYFQRSSEPHMTIAVAGDHSNAPVSKAEINLKFIWDLVSQMKVGVRGQAYVVDARGRLIAHPDISLVLRNTDLARLPQVQAAILRSSAEQVEPATSPQGQRVLSAHAPVFPLGWFLFVELPVDQAYAPVFLSIARSGLTLLAALILAVFASVIFARHMVGPILELGASAVRIGRGDLSQRISIKSGDELEALGDQFNRMATHLQESYATLERKVEQRTHELAEANLAKSRFLAAASHDLRQPLHALNLFVPQLRSHAASDERNRIVDRVETVVAAMNEMFNALLDISRLDAGILTPTRTNFPVARLLARTETTFAGAAREKGLSLRVVPSSTWVHSDFILLERIVSNLVSNAVRYTQRGRVLVGCRRRDGQLRIEVWDSGPGIAENQRQNIFAEFHQLAAPGFDQHGGLGLGLAIVDRLSRLLEHPINLISNPDKGSCFIVAVPLVLTPTSTVEPPDLSPDWLNECRGKLIAVIDDDAVVLEGMGGLLRTWGCRVVVASSTRAALTGLNEVDRPPDLVISDYHLLDGTSGIDAIDRVRRQFQASIPAFLISADTSPERLRDARERGYYLLHKPVSPMALRAMLSQFLRGSQTSGNR